MGYIRAVCISRDKGTVKQDIGTCRIIEGYGLEHDAHAGSERQVSLLSFESVQRFQEELGGSMELKPGAFGENLLVEGYDLKNCPLGTRFQCGEVLLELMQIGKTCHSGCEISRLSGKCIMPVEGVFARVLKGGMVRTGDKIVIVPAGEKAAFRAALVTVSDRAAAGIYGDQSGEVMAKRLQAEGYEILERVLLPDDEEKIFHTLVRLADQAGPDVIFTTGGTGFSLRDRTPEATARAGERNAPGIAEALRAESLRITPRAMLSRGVSVLRGQTLIVNLPGSPKAVRECLDYLLPVLPHGLSILRGENADG